MPVIQNNCLGCHNSSNPSGNVNLNNYAAVKAQADNLRNNIPVLDGAIRHYNGFSFMPPSEPLGICSIRKIELWIAQGKTNN